MAGQLSATGKAAFTLEAVVAGGLVVEQLVTTLNAAKPWQLALPASGIVGLTGPSGGGKSTLLAALAGQRSCSGVVEFAGRTWQNGRSGIPAHKRDMSLGFQDSRLFSGQTVAQNLALAHRYSRRPLDSGARTQLQADFGIQHLLQSPVEQLSGGEAQRVALLRQLFHNAALQLFDEPLAAVDQALVIRRLLPTLRAFWERHPALVLWTSHNFNEIQLLADRCLWMENAALTGPLRLQDVARRLQFGDFGHTCYSRVEALVVGQQGGMLELSLGGHKLFADRVTGDYARGQSVAFLLESGDISLSLEWPGLSSILNCLPVTLVGRQALDDGRVRLQLRSGTQDFQADISCLSFERLGLHDGGQYFAQFKAGSLAGL
ncbi:ATP-binding cassette domain-containing protein [Biformimicrobium ophioploci]|uniref:Molybdenum ABC transporter ATP-binding protein n=1 Tax=Biformimicrobium ophioploci TaxID=3036711 RepID=A0ABQ6M085_9GAMM|nr:ATP-binding cassette domain-containing protein [Microbulbifer sp. NKW57]GMG87724.1 molybdenum ABC transporter ATP-binding protein [Microbulbifer sp. NKW57]